MTVSTIRLSRVLSGLTALGPGKRVGVWVQGCTLSCPGCSSLDTWDPEGGIEARLVELTSLVVDLFGAHPELTGLSLTGGEPVQQAEALATFTDDVRTAIADRELDVLMFTGYPLPVARRLAPRLIETVDAVVAGRYDPRAGFGGSLIGSSNQKLHLLTARAVERFSDNVPATRPTMQAVVDGDDLVLVGIPAPGDLNRLQDRLALAGVAFGRVSWRT